MKQNSAVIFLALICAVFAALVMYHKKQNEEFIKQLRASEQARIEAQAVNEEARIEIERLRQYNSRHSRIFGGVSTYNQLY